MARPFTLLLLAVTAAASLIAFREYRLAQDQAPLLRKAALLASENDSLRQALAAARADAADSRNALRRREIERATSAIRELPFRKPVLYALLDRAGIRQVVAGKLAQQYSDRQIDDIATGYAALGLLPPHFPLARTYIDLLGEQIAAFYDQYQHKLFMFRGASLEDAQNRVILSHELTHALQDQNFGLTHLPLDSRDNDDLASASSALIEGDATLVMSQYMIQDLTWKTFADTASDSLTQSMKQMHDAPRFLREMLVFPYIQGQQFCEALYARGGFQAISQAYFHPPTSTAQILHPEKYFPESREDPIPIRFPDATFRGAPPLADNVLGEMGVRILFSMNMDQAAAEIAASGWRGDRYLVFDHGDSLVWRSAWRSPAAAAAAASAMEALCGRRFRMQFPPQPAGASAAAAQPGHFATIRFSDANEVVLTLSTTKESSNLLDRKFGGPPHG